MVAEEQKGSRAKKAAGRNEPAAFGFAGFFDGGGRRNPCPRCPLG